MLIRHNLRGGLFLILTPKRFCLRGNFPSTMTTEQIKSCNYHPETNPFCPIFRVGDVLSYTGQTIADLADKVATFSLAVLIQIQA